MRYYPDICWSDCGNLPPPPPPQNQSTRDSAYIQTKHLPHTSSKITSWPTCFIIIIEQPMLYNNADLLRMKFKMGWGEKERGMNMEANIFLILIFITSHNMLNILPLTSDDLHVHICLGYWHTRHCFLSNIHFNRSWSITKNMELWNVW
jgi:hypothetical protein